MPSPKFEHYTKMEVILSIVGKDWVHNWLKCRGITKETCMAWHEQMLNSTSPFGGFNYRREDEITFLWSRGMVFEILMERDVDWMSCDIRKAQRHIETRMEAKNPKLWEQIKNARYRDHQDELLACLSDRDGLIWNLTADFLTHYARHYIAELPIPRP